MGSGLSGGPLTGNVTTAALPPAPAGQSAVLSSPLGAGATDVVTKVGSTEADGTVNNSAKLVSFRTGIGATEVEKAFITKAGNMAIPQGAGLYLSGAVSSGSYIYQPSATAIELGVSNTAALTIQVGAARLAGDRRFDQSGTDSTGTPGNAVIDKPTGKSAIAIGAASVTITCSLVAATSIVIITPHARDATCTDLIVVPGAGSFVVSGAAAATAAVPFSWMVKNII